MPTIAITPKIAKQCISSNEIDFFLDVRSREEFLEGSGEIDGHSVVNIPYNELILLERWSRKNGDSKKTVLIFCKKGRRASFASKIIEGSGTWGRVLYVFPGGYSDLVSF
jgi:rhodanese-related sulfurtransferase